MILEKKTALLSPRGAHGICGVARFECFKDKSDVKISLSGGRNDLYAAIAVGDETKVVRLSADRIYLTRSDLGGDCAVLVADGEKRVVCAGATTCGYDFKDLEEVLGGGLDSHASASEESASASADEAVAAEITAPEAGEEKEVDAGTGNAVRSEIEEKAVPEDDGQQVSAAQQDGQTVQTSQEEGQDKRGKSGRKKPRFFDKISDKIKKLFEENEKDSEMEGLIPGSRWARVRTEDGWYVVGVVGDPAEFICYGVPADNASDPPDEKEGCRQWLEVVKGGRGYWMMYQSAETGETLTAI